MSQEELKTLLEQTLNNGINLSHWAYILIGLVSIIGAYVGSYLKKRGENFATKQDFQQILERTSETTRITKHIEGLVQKEFEFIEHQLKVFYSPILGFSSKIKAKSEFRVNLSKAADEAWKELCVEHRETEGTHKKDFEPYRKIIDYNNKQWNEELFPLYEEILEIFTKNYWLAEESTKQYYVDLCNIVDVWQRHLDSSIPHDVLNKIENGYDRIQQFFEHMEEEVIKLKDKLIKEKLL